MHSFKLSGLLSSRPVIVLRTIGRAFRRTRPLSAASRLPQELVLQIFEHYMHTLPMLPEAPHFSYVGPMKEVISPGESAFWQYHHLLPDQLNHSKCSTKEALSSLHTVILVSRSWYLAGTEYLYRHPILLSYRHIRAFSRVLSKYPNVRLARHISVFFQHDWKHKPEYLLSILNNLESLESLVVFHDGHQAQYCPINPQFSCTHDFFSRLRKLTLCGGYYSSYGIKLPFPNLEHLCLKDVSLLGDAFFECELPRLHTLQLVGVVYRDAHSTFKAISLLPSLRVLELYLVYSYQLASFWQLNDIFFESLQELTIGVLDTCSRTLGTWRLPSNLIRMTLLVNLLPKGEDGKVVGKGSLQDISRFLQHNADRLTRKSFIQLRIVSQFNFCDVGDDPMKAGHADANAFLDGDTPELKQIRAQYYRMIVTAVRCRIPIEPVWYNLAGYVNAMLARACMSDEEIRDVQQRRELPTLKTSLFQDVAS
ncbi:unnamed protein product [Somion occarium]|uniref:F-box domain-containing protein n=1 Tax=Somion occarium TaxID=3059160 RepID=A0ABP1DJQ0_9APHY